MSEKRILSRMCPQLFLFGTKVSWMEHGFFSSCISTGKLNCGLKSNWLCCAFRCIYLGLHLGALRARGHAASWGRMVFPLEDVVIERSTHLLSCFSPNYFEVGLSSQTTVPLFIMMSLTRLYTRNLTPGESLWARPAYLSLGTCLGMIPFQ